MTRDYLDVLQNIEFSIVSTFRHCGDIDDRIIASALKAMVAGGEPTDDLSNMLVEDLEDVRMERSDVPDTIWQNGLKVVLESVHTHSGARPGDRDYLKFVLRYLDSGN